MPNLAEIQLMNSFLSDVSLQQKFDASMEFENLSLPRIKFERGIRYEGEKKERWVAVLGVEMLDDPADAPAYITGKVRMSGHFLVSPEILKLENAPMVIGFNCWSMLYGGIREIVSGLTSRFITDPLILPSINFTDPQMDWKQVEAHVALRDLAVKNSLEKKEKLRAKKASDSSTGLEPPS